MKSMDARLWLDWAELLLELPTWIQEVDHTFLPFGSDDEDGARQQMRLKRTNSAPSVLPFFGASHDSSRCKPCAYLYAKADGCRRGANCNFCHICPRGMVKRKKKEKKRRLRQEDADAAAMLLGKDDDGAFEDAADDSDAPVQLDGLD
eukprot:TRINITY_DN6777_c0_g2_i2.p1 TRINITY_DN6777_c0_g2~~TRINITY_DN6777_c0_g2_i2.p1  ORF type:complete len:148 (+),score=27.73 TRINITY_DN6777_c0_g2_i2:58-501(+)